MRKRQFPIVGDGGGVSSFIHLDDAAAATVLALEHDGPAIYNIVVDDEPAPVREWLPLLAEALGAKPPRHFPVWLARMFAGELGVMMGTEVRGASNAKAESPELGWTLRYPSWRQGFADVYDKAGVLEAGASIACGRKGDFVSPHVGSWELGAYVTLDRLDAVAVEVVATPSNPGPPNR